MLSEARERYDGAGNRVCQWCRTRMVPTPYVPARGLLRKLHFTCPVCDFGEKMSVKDRAKLEKFRNEFGA